MSLVLRFAPTDDTVTLPAQFTVQMGNTNVVIEFRVAVSSYPASGNRYFTGLLAGSTNEGLCLRQASGDGALALVLSGTNQADFTSNPGFILNDGALHTYRIERDAGTAIRFYRDGSIFQTKPWVTSSNFLLRIQRFGQGSTVTSGMLDHDFEYFKIDTGGSPSNEEWNANLSGGAGSVLPSVSGSNNGTLVNFDTAVCWVSYGGASIALDSALQAFSSLTADLTTQIQLATQFAGVSSITASLQTGAVTIANLGAVATITAVLTTGIRLNSSMSNTSSISGVLSDAAPELPPQFIPVINSVIPYSNSAAVSYSYAGNDATGYKGRINGGAPFTLSVSPAIIIGLAPETTYALEIAAENSVGMGAWSTPTNFTTIAAGSSDELIIRNIVRPYLRPVLKEIKK